jgi:hypothetical protein
MKNLEIIKKEFKYPCYCCRQSIRGKTAKRKTCKACKGTGFFKDEIYYHIITDEKGNQYCFSADTIK